MIELNVHKVVNNAFFRKKNVLKDTCVTFYLFSYASKYNSDILKKNYQQIIMTTSKNPGQNGLKLTF